MYNFPHRPLHVAARNGLTMVVQELLGKGASVLAVDENGKQAPWPALGQLSMVWVLLLRKEEC